MTICPPHVKMFVKPPPGFMLLVLLSSVRGYASGNGVNSSSVNCDTEEFPDLFDPSNFVGDTLDWRTRCFTGRTLANSILEDVLIVNTTTSNIPVQSITDGNNQLEKYPNPDWYISFKRFQFVTNGICFPLVTITSIIGNILSIIVLCRSHVKSSSYVYLLGLAVANLGFSITFSRNVFRAFNSVKALRSYQTFYSFYVVYVSPLANTFHTSGVWVIMLFTVERFVAVTFPMKSQKYFSVTRSKKAVCSAFAIGIALNFNRFFRRQVIVKVDPITGGQYYSYKLSEIGQNQTFDAVSIWSYLVLTEVMPFPFLVSLNTLVIHRVWQAKFRRLALSTNSSQKDSGRSSRENQITLLLTAIVIAFLLCNAAACAGSIYVALNGSSSLYTINTPDLYYLFTVGTSLYNTNPLVNCILYTVCSEAMRKGMKSVICIGDCKKI